MKTSENQSAGNIWKLRPRTPPPAVVRTLEIWESEAQLSMGKNQKIYALLINLGTSDSSVTSCIGMARHHMTNFKLAIPQRQLLK